MPLMSINSSNNNKTLFDQKDFKKNELFDICYINLLKESKRKEHLEKMLTTANCSFVRFNAINGVAVMGGIQKLEDYEKESILKSHIDLSRFNSLRKDQYGMIGCRFSHYLNLRRIEHSNLTNKPVLILEDDVDLECDFVSKIDDSLICLPTDWDICLISPFHSKHKEHVDFGDNKTVKIGYFYECLGYIVNGSKSAKKIADIIDQHCSPLGPVDLFLAYEAIKGSINVYALRESQCRQMQEIFVSSISTSQVMGTKIVLRDSLYNYVISLGRGINA